MTKEKKPTPREISAEEMKQAGGGRGLLMSCYDHNGKTYCVMY